MADAKVVARVKIRPRITCPHCWEVFPPEDTLWVSQHPDLEGDDSRLGAEQQLRFLPSHFDADGNAIDVKGGICHELACPRCHLTIPRALFELSPLFISICGEQASGKSYFLASMTWRLRRTLPQHFAADFADADPAANVIVNQYEEINFLNSNRDQVVKLDKTQETGHMYSEVQLGDRRVRYPSPFFFAVRPSQRHPAFSDSGRVSRVLTLYDNAGESFRPGADKATAPVTRHLARSHVLFFLFDPTQDPRFREACRGKSDDPQIVNPTVTNNQETILHEMASRVRRYTGLRHNERHGRPLIVVVTKCDAWSTLLDEDLHEPPWVRSRTSDWCAMDLGRIERVSSSVRALLWQHCPGLVASAEAFAKRVVFVPVSATGRSPEVDQTGAAIGIRPRDIRPIWAEVPMLIALCRWYGGLIPYKRPSVKADETPLPALDGKQ